MATVKNIKINNYCDAVNEELASMKMKIDTLREDVIKAYGAENELARSHEQHLLELAAMIEWKLQLLMKSCPFDWKGADKNVETAVSVGPEGKPLETDFSGGYLGG
jgi:hypothetical protein